MENFAINPFQEREEFAKRFLLSCRKMLVDHLILKGTETMRDMVWRYVGDGIVCYEWTSTIHHPPGYHEMGSLGAVTFASFSEWEEDVRESEDWDVLNDCPARSSKRDRSWTGDMIKFMDLVFSDREVSWDLVESEIMPAFKAISKYW